MRSIRSEKKIKFGRKYFGEPRNARSHVTPYTHGFHIPLYPLLLTEATNQPLYTHKTYILIYSFDCAITL